MCAQRGIPHFGGRAPPLRPWIRLARRRMQTTWCEASLDWRAETLAAAAAVVCAVCAKRDARCLSRPRVGNSAVCESQIAHSQLDVQSCVRRRVCARIFEEKQWRLLRQTLVTRKLLSLSCPPRAKRSRRAPCIGHSRLVCNAAVRLPAAVGGRQLTHTSNAAFRASPCAALQHSEQAAKRWRSAQIRLLSEIFAPCSHRLCSRPWRQSSHRAPSPNPQKQKHGGGAAAGRCVDAERRGSGRR